MPHEIWNTTLGIHSLSVDRGEPLDFQLQLMDIHEHDIVRIQHRLKNFLDFERISPLLGAQL